MPNTLLHHRSALAAAEKGINTCRAELDRQIDSMVRALYREKSFLEDKGDIADGEIQVPWDMLQKEIEKLRNYQQATVYLTGEIAAIEADEDSADGEEK